jgi:hypothetical protein
VDVETQSLRGKGDGLAVDQRLHHEVACIARSHAVLIEVGSRIDFPQLDNPLVFKQRLLPPQLIESCVTIRAGIVD